MQHKSDVLRLTDKARSYPSEQENISQFIGWHDCVWIQVGLVVRPLIIVERESGI
jgi:hypothetical protein